MTEMRWDQVVTGRDEESGGETNWGGVGQKGTGRGCGQRDKAWSRGLRETGAGQGRGSGQTGD